MDGFLITAPAAASAAKSRPPGGGLVLYAEEFDDDAYVVAAPDDKQRAALALFDEAAARDTAIAAEAETARAAGYDAGQAEGFAQGLAQAEARQRTDLRVALDAIARGARDLAAAAEDAAAREADAIAGLLLAALRAAFPELCRRHGEVEARAVARAVLPALQRTPGAVVRASPHTLPLVAAELAAHDDALVARLRLVPTDALAPGDVRLEWPDGQAVRDAAALWRAVADAVGDLLPGVQETHNAG